MNFSSAEVSTPGPSTTITETIVRHSRLPAIAGERFFWGGLWSGSFLGCFSTSVYLTRAFSVVFCFLFWLLPAYVLGSFACLCSWYPFFCTCKFLLLSSLATLSNDWPWGLSGQMWSWLLFFSLTWALEHLVNNVKGQHTLLVLWLIFTSSKLFWGKTASQLTNMFGKDWNHSTSRF